MSFEVEIKFRSVDHVLLRQRLLDRGAAPEPAVEQQDTYLAHPGRDFAVTDEALRLRCHGGENRITYKGPKRGGPTKTREEIEIPLAAGEEAFRQLTRLFENLGFRPVATIRKARTTFHLGHPTHRMEVTLDRAVGLGDFVEIETAAAGESELPAAQAAVLALAAELGLTEVEPRSYLRMALEARRASRVDRPPGEAPVADEPASPRFPPHQTG
jgi:adenylate cyclase class 2